MIVGAIVKPRHCNTGTGSEEVEEEPMETTIAQE
jgi:hypothetical protein